MGKESTYKARDAGRYEFDPQVGKNPWRRAWQFTPVFLPGESLGQSSLVAYSPWGCKKSDMTEATKHTYIYVPPTQPLPHLPLYVITEHQVNSLYYIATSH